MILIQRASLLWQYLSSEQKGLIEDGEILLDSSHNVSRGLSDYSYLVFPFSKAYEGFLKRLFLDMKLLRPEDYYSDDIRIGKILNPHYIKEHGSVYAKVCGGSDASGDNIVAERLWQTWKKGRNLVFHYFPHNFRRLSFDEAKDIIDAVIASMEFALAKCSLPSLAGKNDLNEHLESLV